MLELAVHDAMLSNTLRRDRNGCSAAIHSYCRCTFRKFEFKRADGIQLGLEKTEIVGAMPPGGDLEVPCLAGNGSRHRQRILNNQLGSWRIA